MADIDLVRRLVAAENGLAIVSLARADGTVQSSLVNAGVLDREGESTVVAFVAHGTAAKVGMIRKGARPTVAWRAGWEWVAVGGPAQVIGPGDGDPGLAQLFRDVFTAAGGTHDDWDTYDRVMAEERRVAVLVTPERITSN